MRASCACQRDNERCGNETHALHTGRRLRRAGASAAYNASAPKRTTSSAGSPVSARARSTSGASAFVRKRPRVQCDRDDWRRLHTGQ